MRAREPALLGIQMIAQFLFVVTVLPTPGYSSFPRAARITSHGQPIDIHPFHESSQLAPPYEPPGEGLSSGSGSEQRRHGKQYAHNLHFMPPEVDEAMFSDWMISGFGSPDRPQTTRSDELASHGMTQDVSSQPLDMRGHLTPPSNPEKEPDQASILPVHIPRHFSPASGHIANADSAISRVDEDLFDLADSFLQLDQDEPRNSLPVPNAVQKPYDLSSNSQDKDLFELADSFLQLDQDEPRNSLPASNAFQKAQDLSLDSQATSHLNQLQKQFAHPRPDIHSPPTKKQRIPTQGIHNRPWLPLQSKGTAHSERQSYNQHLDSPSIAVFTCRLPAKLDATNARLVKQQASEFFDKLQALKTSCGSCRRAILTDVVTKRPMALFKLPPLEAFRDTLYIIRFMNVDQSRTSRFVSNAKLRSKWTTLLHWVLMCQQAFLKHLAQPTPFQQEAKAQILQWLKTEFFSPESNSLPVVGMIKEEMVPLIPKDDSAFGQVQLLLIDFLGTVSNNRGYQTGSHLVGIWYKTFYKKVGNENGWDDRFTLDKDFWANMNTAAKDYIASIRRRYDVH